MAKQKRSRRQDRPSEPQQVLREIRRRERVAVIWSGALFVLIGVVGLHWVPGLRVVWIVILIFGVATVPQVAVWWLNELKERRKMCGT